MAYQETSTTGYGTRLKNSFGGIASGFVMFVAATALLWWNEGRAVKTSKMLDEAQGAYVVMTDINKVDPQYEGRLVFATGLATTRDSLADPVFGVKDLALRIYRKVEYYQWEERKHERKRDKVGGGEETVTTYTYEMKWARTPVESANFHDPLYRNRNYVLANVDNVAFNSDNVTFGAYRLNRSQVNALPANQTLTPSIPAQLIRRIDSEVRQVYNQQVRLAPARHAGSVHAAGVSQEGRTDDGTRDEAAVADGQYADTPAEFVHVSGNAIYIGLSPATPAVGDVRVTYTKAVPTHVSLLARVCGDTFTNFTAKNGKSFSSIAVGTKSADEMFEGEHASNGMWTWALRLIGVFLVIGGLKGIFGFLETLLKVIPPLAGILGFGVGIICSVVGFVWSLLVIAVSWVFYRPLLGVLLLVVGAVIVLVFSKKGKALIARHV